MINRYLVFAGILTCCSQLNALTSMPNSLKSMPMSLAGMFAALSTQDDTTELFLAQVEDAVYGKNDPESEVDNSDFDGYFVSTSDAETNESELSHESNVNPPVRVLRISVCDENGNSSFTVLDKYDRLNSGNRDKLIKKLMDSKGTEQRCNSIADYIESDGSVNNNNNESEKLETEHDAILRVIKEHLQQNSGEIFSDGLIVGEDSDNNLVSNGHFIRVDFMARNECSLIICDNDIFHTVCGLPNNIDRVTSIRKISNEDGFYYLIDVNYTSRSPRFRKGDQFEWSPGRLAQIVKPKNKARSSLRKLLRLKRNK